MYIKNRWSGAKKAWTNAQDSLDESLRDADFSGIVWLVAIAFFIVIVWICRFVLLSIEPYTAIAGGNVPTPTDLWFIGWVLDAIKAWFTATIAIFIWSIVNIVEVFWIIVTVSRTYHRNKRRKIAKVVREQKTDDTDVSDDRILRRTKRRELKAYTWLEDWMVPIGLTAFVFDGCVNWAKYPIVTDWSAFNTGFTIRRIDGVSWGNAGNFLINMTVFEILFFLLLFLGAYLKDSMGEKTRTP